MRYFHGSLILLAGSLAACHQVDNPNQEIPKVAFEIADVDPTLDEVRLIVQQFAANYGYSAADNSKEYPSEVQIFFVVKDADRASVDLFNGNDGKSLFVGVFAEDQSDQWKTVACQAHAQLAARWPTIRVSRGDLTLEGISGACIPKVLVAPESAKP